MACLLFRLLFSSHEDQQKEDEEFEDFMDFVEEYEYFMEDDEG